MALNNAAADAALDVYMASITPEPANPTAIRDGMQPLFRAIFAGIQTNAVVVVNPAGLTAGGDPVVGACGGVLT